MKYSTLILLGCALAISPVCAEDEKKPERKAPKGGKGAPGEFFKNMDKDGDNAVSKEEAGERWQHLARLDKDEDGKVTMKELAAGRPGGDNAPGAGRPGGKGAPGEFFKRADKNGDGKLTQDEVPEQFWSRLSKADKNEDGAVTQEELAAARPGGPGAPGGGKGKGKGEEMFARADKNKDGKISKDEVPEQAWERLGKLDKNNDGAVTKQEMAAAAMRGKGGPGGSKGEGKGRPQAGGPDAVFGRFDKDKDGKLSESEVPGEMWDKLRRADEDADGLVSKKELGKVYAAREGAGGGPEKKEKKRPELEKPDA